MGNQTDADGDGAGDACDTEGPSGNSNGVGGGDDCLDGVDNDGNGLTDGLEPTCDADGDGVNDSQDNCPSIPNGPAQAGIPGVGNQTDADGDGAGDACDGNDDNDELTDLVDSCPRLAEDYDDYQDGDGCPDYDNDMDGICDPGLTPTLPVCGGTDLCPNLAEDLDSYKDSDRVPQTTTMRSRLRTSRTPAPAPTGPLGPDGIADSGDEPTTGSSQIRCRQSPLASTTTASVTVTAAWRRLPTWPLFSPRRSVWPGQRTRGAAPRTA